MTIPNYRPTIGLEIHAELKTQTKMFCASKNDPNEKRPNVNICPVCMAHPGTLPVINREAVRHVVRIGYAVNGTVADFTEFDRKNYFYPDIPKGYQISQYQYPLVSGGTLHGVTLTRVHLEEDTARSTHERGDFSLIDFNRAGVPLMELVTEPVITSAEEASAFARELQLLLRFLGISDANMEKGEMRVEANVSVSKTEKFGTKVEIKNLNSFRSVERAIAYETERQTRLLEKGERVIQETRGWDEEKGKTFSQRLKEESHDYRYFPDPDLPKLKLSELAEFSRKNIMRDMPELPWNMRERYRAAYGIKDEDIEMYVRNEPFRIFFERVAHRLGTVREAIRMASNYITSDIAGKVNLEPEMLVWVMRDDSAERFADLIMMAQRSEVSSRGVKDILGYMVDDKRTPQQIAKEKGLLQVHDKETLNTIADKIIAANPTVVSDYKKGKTVALKFLVGQGMKESKGSANPAALEKLLAERLQ